MAYPPELDPRAPFLVTVDLAIFATIYLFDAILHQALDILRDHIVRDHDALTPEIVEHIYSQVDADSLLCHLTRAALAVVTQSWPQGKRTDQALEEWMDTIERCPRLGADFFYVQVKGWSPSDLSKGGRCRFHRHLPNRDVSMNCSPRIFCSRSAEECFEDADGYPDEEKKRNEKKQESNEGSGKCKKKKGRSKTKVEDELGANVDTAERLQNLEPPNPVSDTALLTMRIPVGVGEDTLD